MGGRTWTAEDNELLYDWWGNHSVESIAKKLGRTECAVISQINRLGLGGYFSNSDNFVNKNFLFTSLGLASSSYGYKNISWIANRGLPVHKKKRLNQVFEVIYLDEFWEWAEKNQAFIDFSKFEKYALGPEPDWVDAKRKRDFKRSQQIKTSPWTSIDDAHLKKYLSDNCYTYMELSKKLNRTTGAIQRRICDLGLKERPIKANNHIKWTDEEWEQLGEMIKEGYSYELMSDILGRSSKAIRGRVFDMYLTERLDKVRSYIGDGKWGDNRPDIPLRYMRVLSPEDKDNAKALLSVFSSVLLNVAKDKSGVGEEYRDYFQKDMCMQWDDALGCLAGERNCDCCSSFQRIQPQICGRCGTTFYERKTNKICLKCRKQRLKQHQKKYAVMNSRRVKS